MPTIDSEGVRINYSIEGEGPVVIAISGLMSTLATSQYRAVPGLPQTYRLVYGEHRGAGGSDVPADGYSIDRIADDWIAIMDAEHIDRAPILGNSMGSLIAQSIALRHPERVSRLVLSVPISHADTYVRNVVEHWLRSFEAQGAQEFGLMTLLWTLTPAGFNRLAPAVLPLLEANAPSIDPVGFRGQVRALTSFDAREQLGQIAVPTLIVAGADDRVCPPYMAEELARLIPHSELVLLPDAGHLAQTEQPAAYAEAVMPFLAADTTRGN